MRMRSLILISLLATALLAPAAPAAARPSWGLADNQVATLLDGRFIRSGIKRVRITVPYDEVAFAGPRRGLLDQWMINAKAQGIQPLVSFYRTYRCSERCAERRLPSVATFRRYFRLFRKRYPFVRNFSTWNEMNFPAAQPTGRNPVRAAQFYRALRRECSRGRCTVLTGDFRANGSRFSARWLRTFKRNIGRGPHIWGLVPHPDINGFSTRYTRQFLRSVRGDVWVTEAGALNFFRGFFRPSISRQTRAMRYLVSRYARVSSRLRRIYVYHWRAAKGNTQWDSGLLSVSGRRRPAYGIFFRGALRRRAP